MYNQSVAALNFVGRLTDFISDQSKWSQETFGSDEVRGPIGPLKHLEQEAKEAQEAPNDIEEYADCFLLLLDATRRAGFTFRELLKASEEKLEVCKSRKWGAPEDTNEPWHHIT